MLGVSLGGIRCCVEGGRVGAQPAALEFNDGMEDGGWRAERSFIPRPKKVRYGTTGGLVVNVLIDMPYPRNSVGAQVRTRQFPLGCAEWFRNR